MKKIKGLKANADSANSTHLANSLKKNSSLKKSKIQKLKIKNVNKSCSVLSKKKQCNKENHLKIIVNYSEKNTNNTITTHDF